ncbi:ABC transporter permease [Embleya scabrispora]|uniref:ABC transporter permease n=1 Tax=Embleya scabrispora TaxID=159449 RepID=UPI0003605925|nr:ABC transporter permease [Embleya scabrispora]MYS79010.1 FtsX-like permease family protein [Streptomyces sp. SID5474]
MFRFALRNVVAHKARLAMTAVAVLLGVAFVAGTLVLSDTLGRAFKNTASKSFADVSVAVIDENVDRTGSREHGRPDPALTEDTLARLRALPGVARARGVLEGFTGVVDRDGDLLGSGWTTFGTNFVPTGDGADPRFPMRAGRGPANGREIAVDARTADGAGFRVGDTVRVALSGPMVETRLTGVFGTDDPRVSAGGSLVLFDTATAQRLLSLPGRYGEIDLTAAPGTSETALRDAAARVLPRADNLRVESGRALAREQVDQIEAGTRQMTIALLAFAGIALFVATFIIANTFTMLVAQRTRELALLRAVGARRGQVTRIVLCEAAAVAMAASLLGLGAGIALAGALRSLLERSGAHLPAGPLIVESRSILVALLVGCGVTLLAAWMPARRASRIPPVAALNTVEQPAGRSGLRGRSVMGALVTAAGVALTVYGRSTAADSGRVPVAAGVFLVLVGILLLTPLLSRPVVGVSAPFLDRPFGVAGRLARRNAVRNPRRTAATASALTIGLSLIAGLTMLGASIRQAVEERAIAEVAADYRIRTVNGAPVDSSVLDTVARVPGVTAMSPLLRDTVTLDGRNAAVIGVDPKGIEQLLNLGGTADAAAALRRGEILVTADTAKQRGWRIGSVVPIDYPDGTRGRVTIGGFHGDLEQLTKVTVPAALVRAHSAHRDIRSIMVRTATGDDARTTRAIERAIGDNPLITVEDRADIRQSISRSVDLLLNIMYGLLAMAVLIAVLGVINTLAMSVFERRREIGMLRAIGLDRSRVRTMVRLESMVISVFGAVLGVAVGTFLAWGILGPLRGKVPNLVLVVPWAGVGGFLALGVGVGIVAAVWPARTAARADVLTAIGTE